LIDDLYFSIFIEIITGRIIQSSEKGIRVSVDFFDDIYIPAILMQEPSIFDKEKQIWTWIYGQTNDCSDAQFHLELEETVNLKRKKCKSVYLYVCKHFVKSIHFLLLIQIRFRVRNVNFKKVEDNSAFSPVSISNSSHNSAEANNTIAKENGTALDNGPMTIIACTNDFGLGLISWW
jgi:hypothetical protein